MKDARNILVKLNEWLEAEARIISDLEAKSHDHEEKIRLRAEHGMLKKVINKLDEYKH